MSDLYETVVSVTINGDDRDVFVRGHVIVEGERAYLDGGVQFVLDVPGAKWREADAFEAQIGVLGATDIDTATDALCAAALDDQRESPIARRWYPTAGGGSNARRDGLR